MTVKTSDERVLIIPMWILQILFPVVISVATFFVTGYVNSQKYSMQIQTLQEQVIDLKQTKLDKLYFDEINNRLSRIESKLDARK